MNPLESYHVVLVEPKESLNVGSVARAMQNLGFVHLHLVAPRGYDRERAWVTARDASVLLDSLTVHADLPSAIAPCTDVVGLALRKGENPAQYVTLPQWATAVAEQAPRTTALVFGPEDDDLRLEHLNLCRWVVRIPSSAAYPSFNLAQSVLLTLYEITRSAPREASATPTVALPTANDHVQLDRLIDSVMQESGFVRPGSPEPVPALVKNLFRRVSLTRHELSVLMALFGRINTGLQRKTPPPPQ